MPIEELVPLGIQIARALAAAHAAGVIHRDVKPSNILCAGPGSWKLADFGVAHVPDSSLTMTGQFLGSPAYAPPESLVGMSTPAGDVYGLGATLYQAATGTWPRLGPETVLLASVPPVWALARHVPLHVSTAIDRAIAIEPSARPTASELADLLAGVGQPVIPNAPTAPTTPDHVAQHAPPSVDSGRTKRWLPWAVLAAIALLAIVVAALRDDAPAGPSSVPSPLAPAAPTLESELPPVGQIEVRHPRGLHGKAARDWEKVVEKVYERELGKALHELDKFERKHGVSDETRYLRAQLERLPPELLEED